MDGQKVKARNMQIPTPNHREYMFIYYSDAICHIYSNSNCNNNDFIHAKLLPHVNKTKNDILALKHMHA